MTRALPLLAVAVAAFAFGFVVATRGGDEERHLVQRYVALWRQGDFPAMYALLSAGSQRIITEARFAAAFTQAAATATERGLSVVSVGHLTAGAVPVRMLVRTRLFGTLRGTLHVPLAGSGSDARIAFSDALLFPGLRRGEQLRRIGVLGPRGALLADDGTPLARGPSRTSSEPTLAAEIVGTLGPIPPAERERYAALGYPPDAKVGLDGLEHVFQLELAGTPGGTLLAGNRLLAASSPLPGRDVTTTIDPVIESAAITAIAGRYAGMVAMDPRTGALRALAGVAFSALQPPGSTMKIVTVTAALSAHLTRLDETFPIMTGATIDGYTLHNAGGEACGGTLFNAFAVSCNSVFAPLGVRVGAKRLVAMAERFGFNQPPTIPGAAESMIPSAATIGDDLAVGSSAIGRGLVQATALEMTDVAATIAERGKRPIPTLLAGQPPRFVDVTSPHVARLVERMMVAVVEFGTGTAAQIAGVKVAGKTGTAELRNTQTTPGSDSTAPPPDSPQNTDAWFVAYAPVGRPRIVVGALFPEQGAGGDTAAPAVRPVLVSALQRH